MIKNWIKHQCSWHRQGHRKNIIIFSTARSGTTWLAEILATQGPFKIVNEPFNLRVPVVRDTLGFNTWESLLQPQNRERMADYLKAFEDGRDSDLRFKRETPFSEFWHLVTDRILYKILFACEDDIDWFAGRLDAHVIVLLRHPIPVALSREECPRLQSFLVPPFSEHFSAEQLAFARHLIATGSSFEVAVLDWCLQNVLPLRQRKAGWLVLGYEQLVVDPQSVIDVLAARLDLHDKPAMVQAVFRASNSTTKSGADSRNVLRDPAKLRENREWLIQRWKKQVSPEQEDAAYGILERFGIDFYERGSSIPAARYLVRPANAPLAPL